MVRWLQTSMEQEIAGEWLFKPNALWFVSILTVHPSFGVRIFSPLLFLISPKCSIFLWNIHKHTRTQIPIHGNKLNEIHVYKHIYRIIFRTVSFNCCMGSLSFSPSLSLSFLHFLGGTCACVCVCMYICKSQKVWRVQSWNVGRVMCHLSLTSSIVSIVFCCVYMWIVCMCWKSPYQRHSATSHAPQLIFPTSLPPQLCVLTHIFKHFHTCAHIHTHNYHQK